MAKRHYVGDMAYLVSTCGSVSAHCDNIRPGYTTLREAICGHWIIFDPRALLAEHGPTMTIQAWADRLRCSRCGSKDHIDLKFLPSSHEYRKT